MKCETCGQEVKKLKVGDRVEAIKDIDGIKLTEKQGIVKRISNHKNNGLPVLIEFDKRFKGGCGVVGYCKAQRGWWGKDEEFKIVKKGVKK